MEFSKKYNTITKENINEMVIKFYTKILKEDGEVAQVFKGKLGDDINSKTWQEHIVILTNFWSMIALQDTEYQGNPMRAHFDLPLSRDKFGSWLVMFFETIDALYEPQLGIIFKTRAENIAGNFMRNLQL
ncbi:MAG: group III truncated hemoglobin [Arcobacteraceae bacterium]